MTLETAAGFALLTTLLLVGGCPDSAPILKPEAAETPGFTEVVRGVRPRGFGAASYVLEPPVRGREYYVSPGGRDEDPGTRSKPLRTIGRAAELAVAGDVVTILDGTYDESVRVRNSGTPTARIVFQAERRGMVILTGGHNSFQPAAWTGGKLAEGQFYITLKGLIFRGYAGDTPNAAAVRAATGWTLEDCLFDRAGRSGADLRGDDITVLRSTFQYNGVHAFVAWGPANRASSPTDPRFVGISDLRILDSVIRGNYTTAETMQASSASSVAKIMGSQATLVDNVESYENNGPGLWFDGSNFAYTIRNSYFHDNRSRGPGYSPGRGLHLEISWGPGLVEHNVFLRNSDAAIAVNNSSGVEIRRNLMVDNSQCVRLTNWSRGNAFPLRDVSIHHNLCKNWLANAAIAFGPGSFLTPREMNISIDYNIYDPGASYWLTWWPTTAEIIDLADMQWKLGWEAHGQVATIVW